MADFDYSQSVEKDTLEQFRGKPNIQVLHDVLAKQLQDVNDLFMELNRHRNLRDAVGVQLDGIGDIVVLSRIEASEFAKVTGLGDASDDEVYRKYLFYKILKNTNTCTYPELIKAFRMFWEKPLYYHENPEYPATIFLDTGDLTLEDHPEKLFSAPIIKAAGVGIHIAATINLGVEDIRVGGVISQAVRLPMPELADRFDLRDTVQTGGGLGARVRLSVPEQ